MRTSLWSGVIAWLAVLVMLLCVLAATCRAQGQCPGGVCPISPPDYGYGWRPGIPSGHYTEPRPYVCRIKNQIGRAASLGTGTLVCVGSDYGAVRRTCDEDTRTAPRQHHTALERCDEVVVLMLDGWRSVAQSVMWPNRILEQGGG